MFLRHGRFRLPGDCSSDAHQLGGNGLVQNYKMAVLQQIQTNVDKMLAYKH